MRTICKTIESIEFCLKDASALTELVIFNVDWITTLPRDIIHAKNLKHLVISQCNHLNSLPDDLACLTHLEILEIRQCPLITDLPESLQGLPNLKALALFETGITQLPEFISQLVGLEMLTVTGINGSKLKHLPHLSSLTSLHTLIFDAGRLPELPELGTLTDLRRLMLSGNVLTYLPDSICQLTELRMLSLGAMTPQSKLPLVKVKALPEQLGELKKLRRLTISARAIRYLPDSICSIPYLNILRLRECDNLRTLPDNLSDLGELQKLELFYCNADIKPLSDSLSNLPNLESILIDSYNFDKVPFNLLVNQQIDIYLHDVAIV